MLDPKVFKAYDVRGIYPAELDEHGARAIGRAYVEQFSPLRIAVGRDMRLSSPTMAAALIFMLPVIVIFFAAQRVFIEGVTLSGVKG